MKNLIFLQTYNLIRKNKRAMIDIAILDLFFLIVLTAISFVSTQVLPENPEAYLAIVNNFKLALALSILVALAYIGILLFALTYFKHGILTHINALIKGKSIQGVGALFKLNTKIFGSAAAAFIVFFILTVLLLQQEFAYFLSWIFVAIIALLFYPFYNLAQSLFLHRNHNLKNTFTLLKKPRAWFGPCALLMGITGTFLIIFWILSAALGNSVYTYYPIYVLVFLSLLIITTYCTIFFNRIYFALLAEHTIKRFK